MDTVVTANRLLLGRNNHRSLEKVATVDRDLEKLLETNNKIFETFYKQILKNIHHFLERPKWHKTDVDISVDDVIIFVHKEDKSSETYWKLGRVLDVVRDSRPYIVHIEYRNATEDIYRTTTRSTREVSVIHRFCDLDFNTAEHHQSVQAIRLFVSQATSEAMADSKCFRTKVGSTTLWGKD